MTVLGSLSMAAPNTPPTKAANTFEKRALPFLFKKNKSFLISPYSFRTAMSLVEAGAAGETLAELQDLNCGVQLFHNISNDITRILSVQKVWVDNKYPLKTEYADKIRGEWKSEVSAVPFKQHPNEQREIINQWVESNTNQKIKNLIPAGSVTSDTKIVLANAIYFLSNWKEAFDPKQTTTMKFKPSSGKEVEMPFMVKKFDSVKYIQNDKWSALVLPYVESGAELMLVLPAPGQKIQSIAEVVMATDTAEIGTAPLMVYLPKFKLEYLVDFAKFAKELKITNTCSIKADFSNLSDRAKKDTLFVSNIFHKTFMEIDEKGTEAAAATAVTMRMGSAGGGPQVFKADHPFLLVLKYKDQNLFVGYYNR